MPDVWGIVYRAAVTAAPDSCNFSPIHLLHEDGIIIRGKTVLNAFGERQLQQTRHDVEEQEAKQHLVEHRAALRPLRDRRPRRHAAQERTTNAVDHAAANFLHVHTALSYVMVGQFRGIWAAVQNVTHLHEVLEPGLVFLLCSLVIILAVAVLRRLDRTAQIKTYSDPTFQNQSDVHVRLHVHASRQVGRRTGGLILHRLACCCIHHDL